MPKLHELLAVEGQLKGQSQATRTELRSTFEKKRHLFEKKIVTFKPSEEGQPEVTEAQSTLQSTVPSELKWIAGIWTKALDVSYQVASVNKIAVADVVLDNGRILITDAPATALLELEKRATEIQELITSAPTLDPAKGFSPDPDEGKNVFRARDTFKTRTRKTPKVITLAPPTEHHPAQAQLVMEDIPIGQLVEQEWSGLITPVQKANLLERVEELRRAIKKARQRANDAEVAVKDLPVCGQAIFDYVFGA